MPKISRYTIGTALIVLSLLCFIWLLYPLVHSYIFPEYQGIASAPAKGFTLTIPKIKAYSPIIANVDPWNEGEYQEALRHGVAHAQGTGLPGDRKTVYLFAHSTGMPWEQLYQNTVFLRLGELVNGDSIYLDLEGKRYVYRVTNKKEVQPSEISYLQHNKKDQLILQTCTPIGTSLRRLLVFAEPVLPE